MSKKNTIYELIRKKMKHPRYEGHKMPVSRRDFIKMGIIASGGYLMPSVFPSRSWAAARPHIPFLVFDLAGGAGMPANFLVGQKGGPEDLCAKYEQHGWNPRAASALDTTFGLPMSRQASGMLEGLRQTLPPEILNQGTRKLLQMASVCNFSLDDTSDNRLSAITLVSKSGLLGEYLASGIGLQPSLSGGNSDVFLKDSTYKPKVITSLDDVRKLTSLGDRFLGLESETKDQIFRNFEELGADYSELSAAYKDLRQFGRTMDAGDPTLSPEAVEVYDLANNGFNINTQTRAAVVYNVLKGYTGPGVITIGNCDYHDGTQTTGDEKDLEIGVELGRAFHLAHKLQTPLFVQIITDGGVYASGDSFDRSWLGDQNLHSLSVMAYYDPTGKTTTRRLQLGHYTRGGELAQENNIVKEESMMVRSVMANYLAVQGLEGRFEELTGIRLRPEDLDKLLVFG